MFSIQAYDHHAIPGHVGAMDFANEAMTHLDSVVARVGATDYSDKPTGNPMLGLIGGVIGGAGGGYALGKYVFKKSNFWATFFGSSGGTIAAMTIGGDYFSAAIPSILAAYGGSRYAHGG